LLSMVVIKVLSIVFPHPAEYYNIFSASSK